MAASALGLLWFGLADQLWQFVVARLILGAGVGVIVPASRRYIIVNAGDDQGRQLGAFYGAYLAGFVFGPPLAGALTVAFNVKTPFVIFGGTDCSNVRLGPQTRDTSGREWSSRRQTGLATSTCVREMVAALLVVVSFRYSIGVFEPLWAPHMDNLGGVHHGDLAVIDRFRYPC